MNANQFGIRQSVPPFTRCKLCPLLRIELAEFQRKPVQRVHGIVWAPDGGAVKLEPRYALHQRPQNRLAFRPRDVLTNTAVNADAEGEMSAGAARDVEAVGLGPLRRVEIGRAEHAEDFGAFWNRNPGNLGIEPRCAAERMHG